MNLNYEEAALLAAFQKHQADIIPYKDIELANLEEILVLKNLFENNYIDQKNIKIY